MEALWQMEEVKIFPFIEGENVALCAQNSEHAKLYLKWLSNPKVRKYSRNITPHTLEDIKKWFEPEPNQVSEWVVFEVWHKHDKRIIGTGGFSQVDWYNRKANIFLTIGEPDYWNKNIGTEASRMLIEYGFKELNLHKIYAGIFTPNKRSWMVAEKNGFKLEATLKDECYVDGKYVDEYRYYILQDEWLSSNE